MNSGTLLFLVVTHPVANKIAVTIMLLSSNLSIQFIADLHEQFDQPRKGKQQLHNRGDHRLLGLVDVQAEVLEDTHDLFQNGVVLGSGCQFDNDTSSDNDASNNGNDVFCVVHDVTDGAVHRVMSRFN